MSQDCQKSVQFSSLEACHIMDVLTWHRSNSQLKDKYKGPLRAPMITAAQAGYTLHPAHNATVPERIKQA